MLRHFAFIDPSQFFAWAILGLVSYFTPISDSYLGANATLVNLVIGVSVVSIVIVFLMTVLLFFSRASESALFEYAHWIAKLFSDAALGSAGFVVVFYALVKEQVEVSLIVSGIALFYVVLANHIFLVIFDRDDGTRALLKRIDIASGTAINGNSGPGYRRLEIYFITGALLLVTVVGLGVWTGMRNL